MDWDKLKGHYVVSLRGRGLIRKLHVIGGCHRIPGVDYAEFQMLGTEQPESRAYGSFCKQCWPSGLESPLEGASLSTSPATSDSGGSSPVSETGEN